MLDGGRQEVKLDNPNYWAGRSDGGVAAGRDGLIFATDSGEVLSTYFYHGSWEHQFIIRRKAIINSIIQPLILSSTHSRSSVSCFHPLDPKTLEYCTGPVR